MEPAHLAPFSLSILDRRLLSRPVVQISVVRGTACCSGFKSHLTKMEPTSGSARAPRTVHRTLRVDDLVRLIHTDHDVPVVTLGFGEQLLPRPYQLQPEQHIPAAGSHDDDDSTRESDAEWRNKP